MEKLESQEVREGSVNYDGVVDGFEVVGYHENGSVDLGDEIMVNLESYLDDINDRLMISRMVSDSVIKGMVKAVEQEAAENIEAKEQEVAHLKRFLQFHHMGSHNTESLGSSIEEKLLECKNCQIQPEPFPRSTYARFFDLPNCQRYKSFEEVCSLHDNMTGSIVSMKNVALEELNTLKKSTSTAGCSSVRRIDSGSQLVGQSGILQVKECQGLDSLNGMLDSVERIVDSTCSQANASLRLSKSLLCDWQWERDFQREIVDFVMRGSIHFVHEEVKQNVQCLNAQLCSSQSSTILEHVNQISCLRKDLDAILKSLSHAESEHLIPHGSCDSDHFHRKLLSNHSSSSVCEGNGKPEASKEDIPEKFELAQLKHLNREELFSYFNTMIIQMRRDHESAVQRLTENYFTLKREYFKERGSSLAHKKDKEFEMLRKKISETIMKLDEVLLENNKIPPEINDYGCFSSSKDTLEIDLSENSEQKHSLRDKETECKLLSSQLSDATQKVLRQSLAEEKLLQLVGKLRSDLEDTHVETALQEDICNLILHDVIGDIGCYIEESGMESLLKQEIYDVILHGASASGESAVRCYDEDSEVESGIMQGLLEVIIMETLKDARRRIEELNREYLVEQQRQDSLATKSIQMENELRLVAEDNERMKKEIYVLTKLLEEKEKMATKVSDTLRQESEQFELASMELEILRALFFECSKERNSLKDQFTEALKQIETDKVKIQELDLKIEESYMDANEQRRMVLMLSQEKQDHLRLIALKEKELEQLAEVVVKAQKLFKTLEHFHCEVTGKIKASNLRIEDSLSQLSSLLPKAKSITRTGLKYKKILERKCTDLEKAEAEVDLLGDEVDTLLSLLEKLYIALRHYSPVLQHYPGIMEILELMKREMSGEAIKLL